MMLQPAVFSRKQLKPILFALLCTLLLQPLSLSSAGPVLRIDADTQYDFAGHYFSNGEYSRAVDEYKRFIYFFPDDERVEMAMYQCGRAFYSSRRYEAAITAFKEVIHKFNNSELSVKSYFMISESHIRLNQYDAAAITLHNLVATSNDTSVKDEAYYRLGWISIETASWDKARKYFEEISPPDREKFRLQHLSAELARESGIARKEPGLAGALSIVPGGGYLYCERYQDALIAFLLNGALIWAAYEAFDNDSNALGALLSFVEIGFYAGSIYGSVGSAHKFNRSKTEQFIEDLKKNTKINLSGDFKSKALQLSLRFTF